jgi:hypothetical protein
MTKRELRRLIEGADLSQAKAARLIGLTDRSMRRYLAGDVEIPLSVEYALRYVIEHEIEEEEKR